MRPDIRGCLTLIAALFALTCSNGSGSHPDGATGTPDLAGDLQAVPDEATPGHSGCVDVAWQGDRIRGGAGLWNGRLFVLWPAGIQLAETSIDVNGGGLSTIKRRVFSDFTDAKTSFLPSAGTHEGRYLAAAQAADAFLVVTGNLGDQEFSAAQLEVPANVGLGHTSADSTAWDGEAFNVELDSSDKSTWAVRLNPDGSVRQPPTKYGLMADSSFGGLEPGYKISTNPTSGATYLYSATYYRSITGHTRDGKLLSWVPAQGVLALPLFSGPQYEDLGVSSDGGAAMPALSADDQGGAWIAWGQSTNRSHDLVGIEHIASDGALGPVLWFQEFGTITQSLLARGSTDALLVLSPGNALYTVDVKGDKLSAARLLTERQESGSGETFDYREMQLLSDGSTDWLVMQQGTQRTVAVRVLKIAPGCVYPTHPAELLTL